MTPTRCAVAIVVLSLCVSLATACGGGSSDKSTSSPAPTQEPTASPSEVAVETQAAASPAARLEPAAIAAGDLPEEFRKRQQETRVVAQKDFPGLTSDASAVLSTWLTSDTGEFVNQFILVPDNRTPDSLLSAFGTGSYRTILTGGGAADVQTSDLPTAGAPAGAKAFSFSGTGLGGRHIDGAAIAFTHGPAFVVIIDGRYRQGASTVDLIKLANAVDARLTAAGI